MVRVLELCGVGWSCVRAAVAVDSAVLDGVRVLNAVRLERVFWRGGGRCVGWKPMTMALG